jgi:hypothetical protein
MCLASAAEKQALTAASEGAGTENLEVNSNGNRKGQDGDVLAFCAA